MARILLAEPDRAIREFIAGILTECGHDVLVCENVVEASVWLATSSIGVLVTDMVLHGDQGVALSRRCAALGVRTITLTGREFHADQSEAARPPALLEKPFRFSDLHRVLDAIEPPPSTASIRRRTRSSAA
jgi:two-component system, cell cycle response regulator CpdR